MKKVLQWTGLAVWIAVLIVASVRGYQDAKRNEYGKCVEAWGCKHEDSKAN